MWKGINLLVAVVVLSVSGCTTSSGQVKPGQESALRNANSIAVLPFQCADETVANAVRNTIIEMLLLSKITIVEDDSKADLVLKGTITFSQDSVSSGGAYANANSKQAFGAASTSSTAGGYVSGITSQIVLDGRIVASTTQTQVRTPSWIPDPPEVMARSVGKKIRKMLKK